MIHKKRSKHFRSSNVLIVKMPYCNVVHLLAWPWTLCIYLSTPGVQWMAFVSTVTNFSDSWPLKLAPTGRPETPARNYHNTLPAIPEERGYQRKLGLSVLFFRVVTLFCWASGFGRFEGTLCRNLQEQAVQEDSFYYFFPPKFGNNKPQNAASLRRRLESSAKPLWEPEIFQY